MSRLAPNCPHQQAFWDDWEHEFIGLRTGYGGGKTFIGTLKLLYCHYINAFDNDGKLTGCNSLAVSIDYKAIFDPLAKQLGEHLDNWGLTWQLKSTDHQPHIIIHDWSTENKLSTIKLRSSENPVSLSGHEVGCVYCDEASRYPDNWLVPQKDPLTNALSRVGRGSPHRLAMKIFTFTPEGYHSRVHRMFEENKDNPKYKLYVGSTADQPVAIRSGYVEQLKSIYTSELWDQYIHGLPVNLSGQLAYSAFNPEFNCRGDLNFDPKLPLIATFDFPTTVLLGQLKNNELHIMEEFRTQDSDHMMMMLQGWLLRTGYKFPHVDVYGDSSGRDGRGVQNQSHWEIVKLWFEQKMGLKMVPLWSVQNPLIRDRVNTLQLAMVDHHGKRRVFISRNCKNLIKDLTSVTWDVSNPTKLCKTHDDLTHYSDALGYAVWRIFPIHTLQKRLPTPPPQAFRVPVPQVF